MPDHFRGKTGKAREKALREHRRASASSSHSTGMEEADKLWDKSGAQEVAAQSPSQKKSRRQRRLYMLKHKTV